MFEVQVSTSTCMPYTRRESVVEIHLTRERRPGVEEKLTVKLSLADAKKIHHEIESAFLTLPLCLAKREGRSCSHYSSTKGIYTDCDACNLACEKVDSRWARFDEWDQEKVLGDWEPMGDQVRPLEPGSFISPPNWSSHVHGPASSRACSRGRSSSGHSRPTTSA